MARGKEAQKKYNKNRRLRQSLRREEIAAKRAENAAKKAAAAPPVITEADLLAFQVAHFGDDTCPENWFIDAPLAVDYDPAEDVWQEEDDLGYYEDGVKRTLTDEQIEMFRHSELEQIAREERLWREEQGLEDDDVEGGADERPVSALSSASSMDEDLVGLAHVAPAVSQKAAPSPSPAISRSETPALPVPGFASTKRSNSSSTKRSSTSDPSKPERQMKKQRKEEVPYEQRNKRKWEEHIATVDPVKGSWMYESKTENRILRELDDVKAESVELDY